MSQLEKTYSITESQVRTLEAIRNEMSTLFTGGLKDVEYFTLTESVFLTNIIKDVKECPAK